MRVFDSSKAASWTRRSSSGFALCAIECSIRLKRGFGAVLECLQQCWINHFGGTELVLETCAAYRSLPSTRNGYLMLDPGHVRGEVRGLAYDLAPSIWPLGTIARRFMCESRGRTPCADGLLPSGLNAPFRQPA